jgi:hypothetical protein
MQKKINSAYSSAKKVFTSCGIKADTPNVYNDQKLHLNGSKLQGIFERQKKYLYPAG